MGPTALLGIGGIDVIVCTEPTQVFDPAVLAIHGVAAAQYEIVALKSSTHFRAGFEGDAAGIVTADSPGVTSLDLTAFPRRATARLPYPLDERADWSPHVGAGARP
jgi:microcystin degradation protein MlrC